MTRGFTNQDKMSEQHSNPIVNDAELPRMDEIEKLTKQQSTHAHNNEMQDALESHENARTLKSNRKGDFMDLFKESYQSDENKKEFLSEDVFEPQKESPIQREKEDQKEGFVRLRLRVEDGEMSIIGAHSVEGPLLQEESVYGEFGFEMRVEDRRLALGSITDAGEIRGFPPPYPTEDMHGHHVNEQPVHEFAVRIPRQHFTDDNFNRMEISVFRVKGDVDFKGLSSEKSVLVQSDNIRNIARITGITEKNTTKEMLKQINSVLKY